MLREKTNLTLKSKNKLVILIKMTTCVFNKKNKDLKMVAYNKRKKKYFEKTKGNS